MKKQIVEYSSPLDALLAITRRLSVYEFEEGMDSAEFFHLYTQGRLEDDVSYVDWVNDYRHYLALRKMLEEKLEHAA